MKKVVGLQGTAPNKESFLITGLGELHLQDQDDAVLTKYSLVRDLGLGAYCYIQVNLNLQALVHAVACEGPSM